MAVEFYIGISINVVKVGCYKCVDLMDGYILDVKCCYNVNINSVI